MELMRLFWIYFVLDFVHGSIQTISKLDVILHHSPSLTCTYNYEIGNKDLIFIRWNKKIENSSETIPLALMREGKDPEWVVTAPGNFYDHVTLLKATGDNSVSLNLRIDDFVCSDEGVYECQIFTFSDELRATSEMNARAYPGPPRIHDDVIQVKENDSFSIHCHGDVGIPPITLRWSYKPKNTNVFQMLTEGIKQENEKTHGCRYQATSTLRVVMSEDLDGAVFVCATSAELEDPKKFDKVELQLHRTTTTPPPTTTTECQGKSCGQPQSVIGDGNGSANVCSLSLLGLSLFVLVTTVFSGSVCCS